jgi:hypothetical protein
MSQGGLDFRLEQAIDFLAGRQPRFLIASVSFSGSKRCFQARRQPLGWRPGLAKTSLIEPFCLLVLILCL